MSTTVPPRDSGADAPLFSGSALPNEEALRLAFFARYTPLAAQARTTLGDDAAVLAPKVVEGAFVRAWDARTRLATPEQLDAFLNEDVHHAAVRALSRRAGAHRLAGHDSHVAAHDTPPPNEAPPRRWRWTRTTRGRMCCAPCVARDTASARSMRPRPSRDTKRRGTSSPPRAKAPPWKAIGIGVVGLAAILAIGWWVERPAPMTMR